ncbi:MAG TPA: NAD(P)/FAD-dependent oxidoreductase [Ktedonobacterales bacterium]|nr:NAD(P)/FAD-dependent oxidoreductase [Ktedonobacterales bacterium]
MNRLESVENVDNNNTPEHSSDDIPTRSFSATNPALPPRRPHVVIIGGGFAGLAAAHALGHADAQVTVIDRNNHHLFQPLLYQVATADLSPADISAPIRNILRKQKNTETLMAEVTGVDTTRQIVHSRDRADAAARELPYDYLVVATGAREGYFGHDEWAPYAPGLKTITDATAIRRKILLAFEAAEMEPDPAQARAWLTFVIVGGGPTGVEMAGAIADLAHNALKGDFRHISSRSARIVLVEAAPRIFGAFPERLGASATRELRRLGVEVMTGAAVEDVDAAGVMIGGARLAARTVIWAAGVQASPAGRWLGAESDRAGRVIVHPDLSVPGLPNVFVIGDTASAQDRRDANGRPLPGVAPVAMQEGRYVGELIARRIRGASTTQVERPFLYHDKGNLATVGRTFAIGSFGRFVLSGFPAWLIWSGVHILYLVGFRNRYLVMTQWAWAYLTVQRGARLITIDDHFNVAQPVEADETRSPVAV